MLLAYQQLFYTKVIISIDLSKANDHGLDPAPFTGNDWESKNKAASLEYLIQKDPSVLESICSEYFLILITLYQANTSFSGLLC